MNEQPEVPKTRWHLLLGKMLEELLTPLGIKVSSDFPVMSEPPKCDILLLRNEGKVWSAEQKKRLPDGIRDCRADNVLLEFKYTESVNESAFLQALGYDYFYRRIQNLPEHRVGTFLISAKTPGKAVLSAFGYDRSDKSGVYHSSNRLLHRVCLILLNELSDEPHNAFLKCFASRRTEKASAFDVLRRNGLVAAFGRQFEWFIEGLMQLCLRMGEEAMKITLTPEMVGDVGKEWKDIVMSTMTPEEMLAKIGRERVLSSFRPEERLIGLKPEERLIGLKPEERLIGLKLEERLTGLKSEEIEAYLKKLKKSKKKKKLDSK